MALSDLCRRAFLGLVGTALVAVAVAVALHAHHFATLLRRLLGGALAVVALAAIGTAEANELGAGSRSMPPGIVIHDAAETLRDYCRADADGRLWLVLPGGARYELVTSVSDPAILNKGDGSFHPWEAAEVRGALAEVRFPLDRIAAQVFLLPFPRRFGLESAAGPGLILLAPGVMPLTRERQHSEFAHELGHVVQYARMPDCDVSSWSTYRALRGIEDEAVYGSAAPHADRPHEIFAEDFRALFGGPLANSSGSIENARLVPPAQVAGLSAFIQALGHAGLPVALAPSANPARGAVEFTRAGSHATVVELFDVSGRRLATLEPVAIGGGTAWRWNGRDRAGRPVAGGVVLARLRGRPEAATRLTWLP